MTLLLLSLLAGNVLANEAAQAPIASASLATNLPAPYGKSTIVLEFDDMGIRRMGSLTLKTEKGKKIAPPAKAFADMAYPSIDSVSVTSVVARVEETQSVFQVNVSFTYKRVSKENKYETAYVYIAILDEKVTSVVIRDEKGALLETRVP